MISQSYNLKLTMFENFQSYFKKKAGMADEGLHELTAILKSKTVSKEQILLTESDICRYAFFVEKGLLRSYSIDEQGKEHIIQFASENWFITDRSSMYFNQPSDFFIDAIEETRIVLVGADFIDRASEISASFRRYNERLLHKHILYMQRRTNLLLGATAEKRYLAFVELYPDLMRRVPQWMVASYLGITPESLSRVRKELAEKNFNPS